MFAQFSSSSDPTMLVVKAYDSYRSAAEFRFVGEVLLLETGDKDMRNI